MKHTDYGFSYEFQWLLNQDSFNDATTLIIMSSYEYTRRIYKLKLHFRYIPSQDENERYNISPLTAQSFGEKSSNCIIDQNKDKRYYAGDMMFNHVFSDFMIYYHSSISRSFILNEFMKIKVQSIQNHLAELDASVKQYNEQLDMYQRFVSM